MRPRGWWISLVAIAALFSSPAFAQPAPDPGTAQPADLSPTEVEARALFAAGEAAYSAGRFEDSLTHFQRAYELSSRHQLLYNIGLAYSNLGRQREALQAFERYLAEVPDAQNRELVEGRVAALREQVAADDAQQRELEAEARGRAAAEEDARRQAEESGSGPRTAGWILTIGGGAVAIGGAVFFLLGLDAVSTIEDAEPGTPWVEVESDNDNAPLFTGIGLAAGGVGVALAAVGVVLLVSGSSAGAAETGPPEPSARLRLVPGGLDLVGTF
jgi:tetratricopeptide (TPR) repeat protein